MVIPWGNFMVVSPISGENLSFLEGGKDLTVEGFISKLAFTRLDIFIL